MRKFAPLIVFVYNRPHLLESVLEAINKNELAEETELFIYSDGPKTEKDEEMVESVREYIHSFAKKNNFRQTHLIEAVENKGLANSIIGGVTEIIEKSGRVIVLEDDLVTDPHFLRFMNDSLDFYEKNEKIWSIGGLSYELPSLENYPHDVFLCYRAVSWGWGTWKNRWQKVDWQVSDYDVFMRNRKRKKQLRLGGQDMVSALKMQKEGKTDSWAIRWCYQQSKEGMLTVLPKNTLIENIGWDGTGVHCGTENRFIVKIDPDKSQYTLENVELNHQLMKEFREYFSRPLINRILDWFYLRAKEVGIIKR